MTHPPSALPDADLVRRLLREQFPALAGEDVVAVPVQGWDNRTFRVGDRLSARLPSAAGYVPAVTKEQQWLPVLAPGLPLPIPEPVALGRPGCGYPWPWSLNRWLPGGRAGPDAVGDLVAFAEDLAAFLVALQGLDVAGGPVPQESNGLRGAPPSVYDDQTRAAVAAVSRRVDPAAALAVWDAAVTGPPADRTVWVHGDVAPSNLLLDRAGRLCAVLDFGSCAVGDPACDLVIAWTLLHGRSRAAFRQAMAADDATWARARGWALWKALLTMLEPPTIPAPEHRCGWRLPAEALVDEIVGEG